MKQKEIDFPSVELYFQNLEYALKWCPYILWTIWPFLATA